MEQRLRSVNDYASREALKEALASSNATSASRDDSACVTEDSFENIVSASDSGSASQEDNRDWILNDLDLKTNHEQSIDYETERLLVLKSYMILDTDESNTVKNFSFDRLSGMARRIFGVSSVAITLVDLGRLYFLGKSGLLSAHAAHRKGGPCAYTISSTSDVTIVNDTTKDGRFQDHPFVTGPDHVRFYAGAPILSPEGYKIGSFSLIDNKPWPTGLTDSQKDTLKDMASTTMESITNHKALLAQNKELQSASRGLASVAHDLLTPLSGLHLSLSLLNGDGDFTSKMHAQQKESMSTASCCTEVMMKICDSLRINNGSPHQDIPEAASKPEEAQCRLSPTSFDTNTLISRLDQIMASVAKQVPVSIVASATLPPVVRGEEVGVFRAALSLLTNSCERTNTGFIRMTISVLESPGSHSEPKLVFDCEDSGPSITSDEQQQLIESLSDGSNPLDSYATCKRISSPAKWSLLSMVSIVGHIYSLGGTFGISSGENGLENGLNGTTTRFWFKLPLVILDETPQLSLKCDEPLACRKISNADNLVSFVPSTNTSIRRKKALMIDDSIIILKTLSRALSKLGYETSQAANGLEGLKFMQHSTYDLVLCDFLMPIMDGLDCVREYRSWEQLNRPGFIQYIVGISAHASGKDSERGLEIGMNKYMSKPITLKDLDELQTNSDLVAMGKMLDETEQQFENCDTISPKRRKMTPVMNKSMGEFDKRRACLICTDESDLGRLREITENQGWKAVVSSTYADALSHLKSRNWDAVVLDGELAVVSFVNQFRDWEEQNRVHRQRNLYLMSTGFELVPNGSDLAALVQVPPGFDGAVGKPANSDMIAALLRKAEDMRVFGAEAIVVSS